MMNGEGDHIPGRLPLLLHQLRASHLSQAVGSLPYLRDWCVFACVCVCNTVNSRLSKSTVKTSQIHTVIACASVHVFN